MRRTPRQRITERDNPSLLPDVPIEARPLLVEKRITGKISEGTYDTVLGRVRPMEVSPTMPARSSSVVSERRIL